MSDSILTSTKKPLGLAENYTAFDEEIIMHINSVLGTLNQLGLGPEFGFVITDKEATWEQFLGDELRYAQAKTYMYLRVRMLFDPPMIGYVITAFEKQREELEWRINVMREDIDHPIPVLSPELSEDKLPKNTSDSTRFEVVAGLPFARRIRVTNGKSIWGTLDDFEARMQVRAAESSMSVLKFDFTPYLSKSFDGNDVFIEWNLSGAQTRALSFGYYDLILSDVGPIDIRAIRLLHGYIQLISTTTTS